MPELRPRLWRETGALDKLVVDLGGIGKTAFEEALPKVKSIEGRRWNPDQKVWEFPAQPMIAHRLIHQVGAEPSGEVLGWVRLEMARAADEVTTKLPPAPEGFGWPILLPHQRDAVSYLVKHPRAILADDMGLGKTLEAIATVEERDAAGPRLVVAPASLQGRWVDELRFGPRHPETREPLVPDWYVGPVFAIPGKWSAPKRRVALHDAAAWPGAWVVMTWEQVRAQKRETGRAKPKYEWAMKAPELLDVEWAAVVADEAHRAKNRHAQQTRGLWQLQAPIKLALTGTPVLNSPDEIWALLAWIYPETYGEFSPRKVGYAQFFEEYVEYSEGRFGKIITGVKNPDALRFELADKLVRRTKGQVLDLPPKIRTTVPLELTPKQAKAYRDAEHGLWVSIEQDLAHASPDRAARIRAALEAGDVYRLTLLIPNAAARVVRLQQILESPALLGGEDSSAKLDAVVETIVDHPEKPFVVFTKFRGTTELIRTRLERARGRDLRGLVGVLTGDTPPEDRTALVAAFQAGEIEVLAATIAAGGVGLTLTAADTALFVSRDWVPGVNHQAEDRLHRIGQGNTVHIHIYEAQDTVDDGRVAPKNQIKELTVGAIVAQDHVEHRRAT